MIICIEGPDRSGKSSLLFPLAQRLGIQPITRLETCKTTAKCWPYIEPIYLHLLEQLIGDRSVVCDRSMTVSAQVYSRVFDRLCLIDPTPWYERETILYLDTPIDVLQSRARVEGNDVFPLELYERTIDEYQRVLQNYTVIRLDGMMPIPALVNEAERKLSKIL